jgi:hypothetical protein
MSNFFKEMNKNTLKPMTLEAYRTVLTDLERFTLLEAAKLIKIEFRIEIDPKWYQLDRYYAERLKDPKRITNVYPNDKLSKREEIICKLNLLMDMLSISANQIGNDDSVTISRLLLAFVVDIRNQMYRELFLIPNDAATLLNTTYERLHEIFQIQFTKSLKDYLKEIPF